MPYRLPSGCTGSSLLLRGVALVCGFACWVASAPAARAAEPTVTAIMPLGLEIGATTTLTISGTGLSQNPQLLLSVPIAKQQVQEGSNDRQLKIDITLANEAQAGYANLWVVTDEGTSALNVIPLDGLPDMAWADVTEKLPVAYTARLTGSNRLTTTIAGKKGQLLQIEVESQRLGGAVRPVVHLFDAQHLQLAYVMPSVILKGDCRLQKELPADGQYTIEIHDAQYAAGGTVPVRVKIGSWDYADQVFPPAVSAKSGGQVELVGHGTSGPLKVSPSDKGIEALNWPAKSVSSGPRPWVRVSQLDEVVEAREQDQPQTLGSVPIGVSGRIATPGQRDVYVLNVKQGDELNLEVFADRWGSPLDAVLEVQTPEGRTLGKADDAAGTTDPTLVYKVPAKVEQVHVVIRDLYDRGSADCIYRLAITSSAKAKAESQTGGAWKLSVPSAHVTIPSGGHAVFPVTLERTGMDEPLPLTLAAGGLKLDVPATKVPTGSTGALLEIHAPAGVSQAAVIKVHGAHANRQQTAAYADHATGALQPWLAEEIAVATGPASTLSVNWKQSPQDAALVLADKVSLEVDWKLPKMPAEEGKEPPKPGPVQLHFITAQKIPEVNGRADVNQSIRIEKAVEVPADKGTGAISVLIPNTLVGEAYDVAIEARLMSADKKQVLASATTPVRRIATKNPLQLQLADATALTIEPGKEIEIAGQVERHESHKGQVTITLKDLPAGFVAAAVVVKPEEQKFVVKLKAPATAKPGDPVTLNLSGIGPPNPKAANVQVTSPSVPVQLQVVAPPENNS